MRTLTYKFAARFNDKRTEGTCWNEAFLAHKHFNELITAHLGRVSRKKRLCTTKLDRLHALSKQLKRLKKAKQSKLNTENNKKTKLPKEWSLRYKKRNDLINSLIKTEKTSDPLLLHTYERLAALAEERGKGRIPDAAQRLYDEKRLITASAHPVALSSIELDIERRATSKLLRRSSGLYTSTYMLTEEAASVACKKGYHKAKRRSWRHVKNHRVGTALLGNDGKSKPLSTFNISSKQDSGWGTHDIEIFPGGSVRANFHRKIPEDTVVNMVWLQLVKRAKWDLEIVFVCKVPEVDTKTEGGTLGIDMGWRCKKQHSGGRVRRVASLSDGTHIDVPEKVYTLLDHTRSLRGIADKMTNEYFALHYPSLKQSRVKNKHAHIMKNAKLSSSLYLKLCRGNASKLWKSGDRSLDVYVKQRRHLLEWANNLSDKALRIRKAFYRQQAAVLAKQYKQLVIEDLNFAAMARSKIAGAGRFETAPADFRDALKLACSNYGSSVKKIDPAYTSQKCNVCGTVSAESRNAEEFACIVCGNRDHADTNAAKNIRDAA